MAEIFKEAQGFDNHPNRWNHDLSHKSYGTFKAGIIYPVMTQFMQPTDSIKVDAAALLQFMPTPTPLQSNVRVIFHAFYQRMKNIVESFPNFIEQLEEHEMPYILPHVSELKAGSLHDYLDVNCNVVVDGNENLPFGFARFVGPNKQFIYDAIQLSGASYDFVPDPVPMSVGIQPRSTYGAIFYGQPVRIRPGNAFEGDSYVHDAHVRFGRICPFLKSWAELFGTTDGRADAMVNMFLRISVHSSATTRQRIPDNDFFGRRVRLLDSDVIEPMAKDPRDPSFYFFNVKLAAINEALDAMHFEDGEYYQMDLVVALKSNATLSLDTQDSSFVEESSYFQDLRDASTVNFYIHGSYSYADFPHLCPYATQEYPDRPLKIRAYRHRVYESIYNAFYRNINGNQPFMIDGRVQYNKYNTTKADGEDNTPYDFFTRNWELDAFTSCLPSPQQGNPPMVGVTATGRLTVEDDDGTRSTAQLVDLGNGQQGLGITEMNAANDTHRNIMMSLASSGFTINDLRETNALQKFLETNIRKGFRYIDFIKGHFGKAPRHAEMDMPEFIGGFTVKLDVGKVTNTNAAANAENPNDVLGQFAGSAQAFGGSKQSMQYYADDYGYFMVTMCIVPDSAYSQVFPKDLLYANPLDFPFPEFSNLGYQPITYEEFCPGEAFKDSLVDSNKKLTDVFGYQRPQHECVWRPDTLHGQFLTTMNNYCVNRVFEHRPELGDDFLRIKPEDMTRNFTVTKADEDIAFGQLAFHITMKQPVPRIAIPSIGR